MFSLRNSEVFPVQPLDILNNIKITCLPNSSVTQVWAQVLWVWALLWGTVSLDEHCIVHTNKLWCHCWVREVGHTYSDTDVNHIFDSYLLYIYICQCLESSGRALHVWLNIPIWNSWVHLSLFIPGCAPTPYTTTDPLFLAHYHTFSILLHIIQHHPTQPHLSIPHTLLPLQLRPQSEALLSGLWCLLLFSHSNH